MLVAKRVGMRGRSIMSTSPVLLRMSHATIIVLPSTYIKLHNRHLYYIDRSVNISTTRITRVSLVLVMLSLHKLIFRWMVTMVAH